jgi:hypothetical protein
MAAMAQTSASHPSPAPATPNVYVHIGAPKTGTTFVQNVLWRNREQLAADGVLYPYESKHEHFPAMLDLRERGWGAKPAGHHGGTWGAVARRSVTWSGHTVILGNEILGGATEPQIRRLIDSLAPAEVHVIFTARDLARQLVSDWQEHIKHKHTITLEAFVDELIERGLDAQPPFGEMFWGLHDAEHVLQRWAKVVPSDRIHLITLPPPGTPGNALWQRFCTVTGLDPERYSLDVRRSNVSLGRAEAEVVRRINRRVGNVEPPHYDALVRLRLTGSTLKGKGGRLVLPEGRMSWARERSRTLIDALATSGYDVVGDLEELMPRPEDHEGYVATRAIPARQMLPVAIKVNATLLRVAANQRDRIRRYRRELGELPAEPTPAPTPESPRLRDLGRQVVAEIGRRFRRRT